MVIVSLDTLVSVNTHRRAAVLNLIHHAVRTLEIKVVLKLHGWMMRDRNY